MTTENKEKALDYAKSYLDLNNFTTLERVEKLFIVEQRCKRDELTYIVTDLSQRVQIDIEVICLNTHNFVGTCQKAHSLQKEKELGGHVTYAGPRFDGQKSFSWLSDQALKTNPAELEPLDIEAVKKILFPNK